MKIGQQVVINCPAYKNGKKITGTVVAVDIPGTSFKVRVTGNKKCTVFAGRWLKPAVNKFINN